MRSGPATCSSSNTMLPSSGISNPAISRSSVVLPEPEAPTMAVSVPAATDSVARSSARTSP